VSWIGHNGGPDLTGTSWRRHCWARARESLLPRMPLEVVRRRVERAAELGLDYKTYAGIRASTGRDVVALLFSTNALRMERAKEPPADRIAHICRLRRCDAVVLAQSPHDARVVAADLGLEAAQAPLPLAKWREARRTILAATGGRPVDSVVLIGATSFERSWAETARLASFLREDRFFRDQNAS
jgi:hypothetical protein